jgi:V/A-type H+-transporting ATPase subunit B
MGSGIGEGRTRAEHREVSDQLSATYARGREALTTAAIIGRAGLTEADQRAADFTTHFEAEFIAQRRRRTIGDTLEVGWRLLEPFPREELLRIKAATWERRAAGEA